MTVEDFETLWQAQPGGGWDFVPAVDRRHSIPQLCGMIYLVDKLQLKHIGGADHDIIYIAPANLAILLDELDIVYLRRCGINYNREEGFYIFV